MKRIHVIVYDFAFRIFKNVKTRRQMDRLYQLSGMLVELGFLFLFWLVWNGTFVNIMPVEPITLWQAFLIYLIARGLLR